LFLRFSLLCTVTHSFRQKRACSFLPFNRHSLNFVVCLTVFGLWKLDAGRHCWRKASTSSPFKKRERASLQTYSNTAKMQLTTFGTYVMMDLLFAACGGLLLIFALVTQSQITQTPTINNVATDLLLDMCPLTGMKTSLRLGNGINHLYSCDRECRLRLCYVPSLRSRNGDAHDPRLPQIPRLPRGRQCALHDDNRSHDLVRDAEDTEQPLDYLEPAAGQYTKSSATKSSFPT